MIAILSIGTTANMPIRTGIDITSVERIEATLDRFGRKFHEKYFAELRDDGTHPELPAETYAGLWATKEAVFKAIGLGFRWSGVSVRYEQSGRPVLDVDYEAARLERSPIPRDADWDCSIAHDAGKAIAVAVCYWSD